MKKDNVFEEIVKIEKKEFQNAIDKAFEKKKPELKKQKTIFLILSNRFRHIFK